VARAKTRLVEKPTVGTVSTLPAILPCEKGAFLAPLHRLEDFVPVLRMQSGGPERRLGGEPRRRKAGEAFDVLADPHPRERPGRLRPVEHDRNVLQHDVPLRIALPACRFRALTVGNVFEHAQDVGHASAPIPQWGRPEANVDRRSVSSLATELDPVEEFACQFPLAYRQKIALLIVGHVGEALSQHLGFAPPEDSLGSPIPHGNPPLAVEDNNGQRRCLEHGFEKGGRYCRGCFHWLTFASCPETTRADSLARIGSVPAKVSSLLIRREALPAL